VYSVMYCERGKILHWEVPRFFVQIEQCDVLTDIEQSVHCEVMTEWTVCTV